MQSNMLLNEYWPAYTKLQQRAPQNHRTGFIIGRIVQAQTRKTENPWTYAGGKNKHTQFHVGHVLLHCLVLWSAIPFRIIFKDILFSSLLALKTCQCLISSLLLFFSSPLFLSCCQSLEQFLCEFTPKLNKILSASSKFTQYKHRKC